MPVEKSTQIYGKLNQDIYENVLGTTQRLYLKK